MLQAYGFDTAVPVTGGIVLLLFNYVTTGSYATESRTWQDYLRTSD